MNYKIFDVWYEGNVEWYGGLRGFIKVYEKESDSTLVMTTDTFKKHFGSFESLEEIAGWEL